MRKLTIAILFLASAAAAQVPYMSMTGAQVTPGETYTLRILVDPVAPPANPRTIGGVMQVHLWRTNGNAYCEYKLVTLSPTAGAFVDTPIVGNDFPRHNIYNGVPQPEAVMLEDWYGYSWRLTRSDGVVLNTGGAITGSGGNPARTMIQLPVTINCN